MLKEILLLQLGMKKLTFFCIDTENEMIAGGYIMHTFLTEDIETKDMKDFSQSKHFLHISTK